jgi:hypothetical protein
MTIMVMMTIGDDDDHGDDDHHGVGWNRVKSCWQDRD